MFHPAYLLRQPAQKRLAWRDLLAIRRHARCRLTIVVYKLMVKNRLTFISHQMRLANLYMIRTFFLTARMGHVLRWSVALLLLVGGANAAQATMVHAKSGPSLSGHGLAPLSARDRRLYQRDRRAAGGGPLGGGRHPDPAPARPAAARACAAAALHAPGRLPLDLRRTARLARAVWRPSGRGPGLPAGAGTPPGRHAGAAGAGRRLSRRLGPGAPGGDGRRLAQRARALACRGGRRARMASRRSNRLASSREPEAAADAS